MALTDPAARAGHAERVTVTSAADRAAASPLLRCLSDSTTITAANDHTYTEHASAAQIQGIPPRPREMTDAARRAAGSGGSVSQKRVTHRLPLTAGARSAGAGAR